LPDFSEAISEYRKALQIDPAHYWSNFQLARCLINAGKLPEAIEAFGTCIALKPEAPWAYSARGIALTLTRRFDEAKRDLDRAIKLDPDFRPAQLNRGYYFWLQDKPAEAQADFDAVLQPPEQRRLVEAEYFRARVFIKSNQNDKALDDLNDVIKQRPEYYPAYLLRAQVQLVQSRQVQGLEDLASVAKLTATGPSDAPGALFAQRGRLFRRLAPELPQGAALKAVELADEDLEQAVKLNPKSVSAWADVGAVREMLGRNDAAIAAYTQAIQLDPADVKSQMNRAWVYQRLTQYDKAQADFQAVISRDPANAEAHTGSGYVYACQNHYDEAHEQAERALLHGAGDYLILHNVACIYAEISKTQSQRTRELQDAAIATLSRAIELWHRGNLGPDEIDQIKHEPAFAQSLRARPEFQQLLTLAGSGASGR
jgi:tetratricopeptide (TPR) repeat protein